MALFKGLPLSVMLIYICYYSIELLYLNDVLLLAHLPAIDL